jgi:DNA-binding PucR family transcriptional regulator
MKYRYKNIAEFLSVDLEDSENRFNIALALRLYKMSRA